MESYAAEAFALARAYIAGDKRAGDAFAAKCADEGVDRNEVLVEVLLDPATVWPFDALYREAEAVWREYQLADWVAPYEEWASQRTEGDDTGWEAFFNDVSYGTYGTRNGVGDIENEWKDLLLKAMADWLVELDLEAEADELQPIPTDWLDRHAVPPGRRNDAAA